MLLVLLVLLDGVVLQDGVFLVEAGGGGCAQSGRSGRCWTENEDGRRSGTFPSGRDMSKLNEDQRLNT